MKRRKRSPKFFEEIKAGLEEALAWAMGEDVPVTIRKVESPGRRTSPIGSRIRPMRGVGVLNPYADCACIGTSELSIRSSCAANCASSSRSFVTVRTACITVV